MKKVSTLLISGALALGLTSCANYPYGYNGNTVVGGVAGGVAGGFIGNAIGGGTGTVIGAIGGTLLGAFIGSQVGYGWDRQSFMYANDAGQRAFCTGRTVRWGNCACRGKIVPYRKFCCNGMICRRFKVVTWVNGCKRVCYGVACKTPCGQWVVRRY